MGPTDQERVTQLEIEADELTAAQSRIKDLECELSGLKEKFVATPQAANPTLAVVPTPMATAPPTSAVGAESTSVEKSTDNPTSMTVHASTSPPLDPAANRTLAVVDEQRLAENKTTAPPTSAVGAKSTSIEKSTANPTATTVRASTSRPPLVLAVPTTPAAAPIIYQSPTHADSSSDSSTDVTPLKDRVCGEFFLHWSYSLNEQKSDDQFRQWREDPRRSCRTH